MKINLLSFIELYSVTVIHQVIVITLMDFNIQRSKARSLLHDTTELLATI